MFRKKNATRTGKHLPWPVKLIFALLVTAAFAAVAFYMGEVRALADARSERTHVLVFAAIMALVFGVASALLIARTFALSYKSRTDLVKLVLVFLGVFFSIMFLGFFAFVDAPGSLRYVFLVVYLVLLAAYYALSVVKGTFFKSVTHGPRIALQVVLALATLSAVLILLRPDIFPSGIGRETALIAFPTALAALLFLFVALILYHYGDMDSRIFRFVVSMVFAVTLAYFHSLLFYNGAYKTLDLKFLDLKMLARGERPPMEKIVIVAVDDESELVMDKHLDPPRRTDMAGAITNLADAGADTIALDYRFAPDESKAEANVALQEAIDYAGNVVLAFYFKNEGRKVQSADMFRQYAISEGMISVKPDADGVLRRNTLNYFQDTDGAIFFFFPVEILRTHENIYKVEPVERALLLHVTADEGDDPERVVRTYKIPEKFTFEYVGQAGSFARVPFHQAVSGDLADFDLDGKIILLGDTRLTSGDVFQTPFSRYETKEIAGIRTEKYSYMPGIEVHANALQTLFEANGRGNLNFSFRRDIPPDAYLAGYAGFALLIGFFFFYVHLPIIVNSLLFLALEGAALGSSLWLFGFRLWPFPAPGNVELSAVPLFFLIGTAFLGAMLFRWILEARRTQVIKEMFGKYLSRNIMEKVLSGDIHIDLRGRRHELSLMFSDIRGFTSASENLGPEQVSNLLNSFFSSMLAEVFATEGTLDKLMGDCIMAFWNDPVEQSDHPERAARTALKMMTALEGFRAHSPLEGADKLNIGIGVNTGDATVGNMGSQEFFDYTALGDSVNLASRLEGLNKYYGTNIIVSESTWDRIKENFTAREIDRVVVKGKSEPIRIYELVGETHRVDADVEARLAEFSKGYGLYLERKFEEARGVFESILFKYGRDPVAVLYTDRCREFIAQPPPEDWNGVTVMETK